MGQTSGDNGYYMPTVPTMIIIATGDNDHCWDSKQIISIISVPNNVTLLPKA